MTNKINKNSMVMQGSILAIASLIVRIIGLVYRIPLTRLLTDEGMGYYENAFVIYMLFLMISTYGFPTAVSKLTSTKQTQNRYREAHMIFKSALVLGIILGVVFAAVLWFGAEKLAILSGTPNSAYAIQALAPALIMFSLLASFRGYFQGMNNMIPTAISQIFEQIFNAVFSLLMAWLFLEKSLAFGAAGGTLGTGIGALAALVFMSFVYMMARKKFIHKRIQRDTFDYEVKHMTAYWKIILGTSIPIILGTAILNFTGVVDTFMFQRALILKGFSQEETATLFGIYSAKYKTLTRLPTTIAASIAVASVPSLTSSVVKNNQEELNTKIGMALRTTLIIAFPATVGELVLARPIIQMLFGTSNLDIATRILQIGAVSIIFLCLYTVCIGIMQGLDKLKTQAYICLIGLGAKIIMNIILFYIFSLNIYGLVIANILSSMLQAYLNIKVINKTVKIKLDIHKTITIPLFSSIIMGIICYIAYKVVYIISMSNTLAALIAILFAVITYGMIIVILKGITKEELLRMPKGDIIVRMFSKLGLL
jgi:stage V sporulation protein B